MSAAIVTLKPGKDQSLRRLHPWVFSGAIARMQGEVTEGQVVAVHAHNGEQLGMGHYAPGSIAVRMLAFGPDVPAVADEAFWTEKLQNAYRLRHSLGLTGEGATNVYRLVHAEGDGVPGLIIDVYGDVAVVQAHSAGMYLARPHIAKALQTAVPGLRAIYDKSAETVPQKAAPGAQNGYLFGESTGHEHLVQENGHRFAVDWETGQKTGFFIDQRDNRALLARYAPGRRVLNTFCYTGGFSVYALQAGAELVHSVDSSKKAVELTNRNAELTGLQDRHEAYAQDVFTFLKDRHNQYDLIVLDPPAFAKHLSARHNALMGYKRLNVAGIKQISPGGLLFTFSCSQVVSMELFEGAIMAAAIEAGRPARILHRLTQPADHPVSLFHPEGEYLKGLVLAVD
ncbi:class I SAM-dependent rRNA methyltransferase [Hymenobacter busanensis]|uniref:Class I SAM-dependent rRNA methyltransferase n=1 Tax=Hymenobacter busanensis TaxID=2607656 RepID=A0A7L4ZXP2_9BACT|nr:class I SAM-dependent rRNA methyltransferase [Hymenobacter busanensis]KAA9333046.1 class I SAM-dependent rRNA methyltransferase [Hymenobacter busanensis]QHJ08279.1 methyltransferase [Hymenobacter busanensis]